jgi:hypothetical protein
VATVRIARQDRRAIPRDVVVAFALLTAAGAAIASLPITPDYPIAALLIGLTAGAFAMVLDAAIWAVAPLLIVEFSIKYFAFGATTSDTATGTAAAVASAASAPPDASNTTGITLRLLVILAASLLSASLLLERGPRLFTTSRGLRVVLPALAFVVIATTFDLPREPPDEVTRYLRYQVTQLAALFLVACLVRRARDARIVLGVGCAVVVASALLAIWQYQDPLGAVYSGPGGDPLNPLARINPLNTTLRAVGLTGTPIQLAGATGTVVPVMVGIVLCGGIRSTWGRWAVWAAIIVLGLATYLTFTRAAMLAVAGGVAAIAVFLPLDRRVLVWGAIGGAGLLYLLLEGTGVIGERYYQGVSDNDSAASHLALFEVGSAIALDNPLTGIGHSQFQDVATGYTAVITADARTPGGGVGTVGTDPPHDDFLLVSVSWGAPALIAYVAIFVGTLANCAFAAARARNVFVRATAIGTVGGLIGYGVSSALHNYLDSSLLLWMMAGLSIALAGLATQVGTHMVRYRVARD